MHILPEKKPDGLQMWPLGHGIVANTVAVVDNNGMFIMAGVPDHLQEENGEAMEGDTIKLIRALIDLPENQSCVMVFPTITSVDAQIARLEELKDMMAKAQA